MTTSDIWAPRIITRHRNGQWQAFRAGDESGGPRGYGETEALAIRNLETSFPDDGAAFTPSAYAEIVGATVRDLRRKLNAAAPECANERK